MDLKIVLGGDRDCQPDVAQTSSQCICSLLVDAFYLAISSTDQPILEMLHIACFIALDLLYPVTWQILSPFQKLHEISNDLMLTNCI
jgi:hypothetical protein